MNFFNVLRTLFVVSVILTLSGCSYKFVRKEDISSQKSELERQNQQIKLLNSQIEELNTELREKSENAEKQNSTLQINNSNPSKTDPVITVEKCQAQAKLFADSKAKRDYLAAFENAMNEGDAQTAQIYLEASFKPDHPADYDSNYQSEYIKCLSN